MIFFRCSFVMVSLLCLAGCKVELYSGLSENEANKMLALLLLNNIDSEKKTVKDGSITVNVEKERFPDSVEILRQNGLPHKKIQTLNDLFPSGQLITSPVQEQAKIIYLKEKTLEKMLLGIDGVIDAQVAIAESDRSNHRRDVPVSSASIFIKHTPSINMLAKETNIRRLIQKGVPNLPAENISIVIQSTNYRYKQVISAENSIPEIRFFWLSRTHWLILITLGMGSLLICVIWWSIGKLKRKT